MTKKMWAVGEDDGEGWIAVSADTEAAAKRAYTDEWHGADVKVPGHIIAQRVEAWDALTGAPEGKDWLTAGLSYLCEGGCGSMACLDGAGKIIDGKPYCEDCPN
ncbi:hypothetical protein [Profundibacterium mesophilum]|uniref:Uncharacterized protein n=1 Tax=Profundibacterium mesophilum KAUST100406-0324 TaxID=1037889 RepID=A0A921NQY2_9RHOB|nr:hypothetical protein [Profundibacterium mesophilum]KAF0674464.1 hypothetical protein PMES_03226 [Profundibacterium mesophilum KAUST100406-0324]